MKLNPAHYFLIVFVVLIVTSCDPSTNKANLERLLSPASLPYSKPGKLFQVASTDSTGQNNDRITIAPGVTATILNVSGPGIITRIWFTVDSRDPYFLRRIVLKMYWDDEPEPSVNVPLGDFFGCGFEYKPYISQYLGMTSGGYICYFPMPFEKSARIEIQNETGQEIYAFYYQINYFKLEGYLDRSVGYFHAFWNRNIRTNYDSNYTILNMDGQGHVVGVNLNMQSYDGGLSYLEGNEKIFVDGEKKPSIVGTGTEDYFSSGWYFNQGEFAGPYHGLILKDDSLGRIAAYRLHITDPIPFKKHILFTIEHGHRNTEIADYASTVYWYQLGEHMYLPSLPKAGMRIPLKQITPNNLIEAEDLPVQTGTILSKIVDVSDLGPDWSGGRYVVFNTDRGNVLKIELKNMFEAGYTMNLFYSTGPDYGNVRIYSAGKKVGEINGYSPIIKAGGKVSLSNLSALYGKLEFKLEVVGKDPLSKGYLVGLDGAEIIPNRLYIPDWYILGPFPNRRITETQRLGLDSIYPPEIQLDIHSTYTGMNSQELNWKYIKTPENGYVSLWDKMKPNELVVTYAVTFIYSTKEKDALVMIGSDDGAKLFINDKEVYRFLGVRIAEPDQVIIPVHLNSGWNTLLLKIENNLGGYAFYARILDPGNSLFFSAKHQDPPTLWLENQEK
ncbi:MAG: glycoside hydrolase family 172 protein [bacterium]